MNAGQMIVQIPLGTMLASVVAEPSVPASAVVGEQDAGAFAGILNEQLTQKPVVAEIATDTTQPHFSDVRELKMSSVIEEAGVWGTEQAMAAPAASLLVALGVPQQAQPAASNSGGGKTEELIGELQQTEVKIPQKVEMDIVGAQAVLASREDGRMPTREPNSGSQNSTRSSIGPDIPQDQMFQTNVPPHLEQAQSAKLSDAVTVAMQDQFPRNMEAGRGIAPAVLMPQMENTTASELKSVSAAESKPAPPVSVIQHKQEPLIKVNAAEVTAIQEQPQNVESREAVSQKVLGPQMNGRMPVMEQTSLIQGQFASQSGAATKHAAETVPSVQKSVAGEQDDTVLQQRVSKLEIQLEPAVVAAKPASSNPAEFRFARSAAVDVALGNGQGNSPHIMEKTGSDSVRVKELQPAVSQQPEMIEVASSEIRSVFGDQKFAGLMQQGSENQQPVVQPVTAGQHPVSAGTSASAPLQAVAEEPSRLILHENIAGQVRERISTHEIKAGGDQIVFRLSPENLGEIKVHLRLEDQRLRVEIVAENRVAREGLIQHMDSLKESLSRHNISIDKFTVTSGESQANGQGGNSAQNEWRELARNRQSQQWMTSGGYRIPSDEPVPLRQAYLGGREHSMLDVHF